MTSLKFLALLNNIYTNPLLTPGISTVPSLNPLLTPGISTVPSVNSLLTPGISTIPSLNPIGVPTILPSVIQYQNVNADSNLRTDVTKFFNKKVINHITENSDLNHLKKELEFLKSSDGWKFIYKLLRRFVKNSHINWYDLRDNYKTVRDYIISKL